MRKEDKYESGKYRQVKEYEKGIFPCKVNADCQYNQEYEKWNIKVFDIEASNIFRDRVGLIYLVVET